jgi:hypothetical protein
MENKSMITTKKVKKSAKAAPKKSQSEQIRRCSVDPAAQQATV